MFRFRPLLASLVLLTACDPGGLRIDDEGYPVAGRDDDGSDDDTAGIDDTGRDEDTASDDDTGNPDDTGRDTSDTGNGGDTADTSDTGNGGDTGTALVPSDCGPYNPPGPNQTGQTIYRITGSATLRSTGFNSFAWSGCEVARYFDATGELECETVYEVSGTGEGTFSGFVYEVDIEVDRAETSCTNQSDITRFYRVSPGLGNVLGLERSRNGQNGWVDFGDQDFTTGANNAFLFDYESPFFLN